MVNVATDLDFNIEGEVKHVIDSNYQAKSNFIVRILKCFLLALFQEKIKNITI
jgi:hypothetical protein